MLVDSRLGLLALIHGLFELPRVSLLVVNQTRIIIAFVEILEHRREYFGLFVRQSNLLVLRIHHLALQHTLEERRHAEDILVSGEDSLVLANHEGDDGRGQVTVPVLVSLHSGI